MRILHIKAKPPMRRLVSQFFVEFFGKKSKFFFGNPFKNFFQAMLDSEQNAARKPAVSGQLSLPTLPLPPPGSYPPLSPMSHLPPMMRPDFLSSTLMSPPQSPGPLLRKKVVQSEGGQTNSQ